MTYQEVYDHFVETAFPEAKDKLFPVFVAMVDYEGVACRSFPCICHVGIDRFVDYVKEEAGKSEVGGRLVSIKCFAFYDLDKNKFVNMDDSFVIKIEVE